MKEISDEIKCNKVQQCLSDSSIPLTVAELEAGGWWCADTSEDCAFVLEQKGLRLFNAYGWFYDNEDEDYDDVGWISCEMNDDGEVERKVLDLHYDLGDKKEIHRIGNEFYWSD